MKLFNLAIVFCFLLACTDKKKIPSDVLDREKMEKVLWDMMVADRFAAQYVVRDSARLNVTDETFKLYSQVFALNNITREQFVKSYKFYLTRPDLSKVLFDSILVEANRQKEDLYRPKSTPEADSANKANAAADSLNKLNRSPDSLKKDSPKPATTKAAKP